MDILSISITLSFTIICVALVLAFYRIVVGPSLPDRVVAIDMLAYLVMGFLAVFCVAVGQSVYLDIALVLAIIAFLGTIAFARYLAHPKVESKS